MKRKMMSRRRSRSRSFNPGHEELNKAVQEFVTSGGKITQIAATDSNLGAFMERKDERAVDDFLLSSVDPRLF